WTDRRDRLCARRHLADDQRSRDRRHRRIVFRWDITTDGRDDRVHGGGSLSRQPRHVAEAQARTRRRRVTTTSVSLAQADSLPVVIARRPRAEAIQTSCSALDYFAALAMTATTSACPKPTAGPCAWSRARCRRRGRWVMRLPST